MKLTNGEIYKAKEPLGKLLDKTLPVKTSYNIARLANKIGTQYNILEQVRLGLFKKYGKSDPKNPMSMSIDPASEEYVKFIDEMGELMGQEIELVFDVIELPQTLEIEPMTLMLLEKFIKVG